MKYTKVQEVKTKVEGCITAEDIKSAFSLPEHAKVYFQVPGGGDWSRCNLDIDRENPVWISYFYTKNEES